MKLFTTLLFLGGAVVAFLFIQKTDDMLLRRAICGLGMMAGAAYQVGATAITRIEKLEKK